MEKASGDLTHALVERYLAAVFDLATPPEALARFFHPDAHVVVHPNLVAPDGDERSPRQLVDAFTRGARMLARQEFMIREVRTLDPDTVVVRGVWTGTTSNDGPLPPGAALRANVAMFVTVRDGMIWRQENFDCYDPLPW